MNDFNPRLVVSSISILATVFLVTFAYISWVVYLAAFVLLGLSSAAVWEYAQFAKEKGSVVCSSLLILLAAGITFSFLSSFFGWHGVPQIVFFLSILILFASNFYERKGAVLNLAVSSFGLLYIALPIGMILAILSGAFTSDGRMWTAYLLVTTKISDMGGYFGGNLWGRRKLAPKISPGKTWEGACVGLVLSLLASFFFHLLGEEFPSLQFHLSSLEWVLLGLILGTVGQFSDLSESLLKRDANLKDSNRLPGVGGVLDSLDSLLFNAPILYFYLFVMQNAG